MTGEVPHPQETDTAPRRRRPTAGLRVGILVLATTHDLAIGNVQHADSFPFPVAYGAVHGVDLAALMCGDPSALPPIVAAARGLEALGVDIIAGACGSFAHYQAEVAAAVDIPACLSILMQVPLLLRMLPPSRKLGIVFARTSAFTPLAQAQCAITAADLSRIVAVGADRLESFAPILRPELPLGGDRLRQELVAFAMQVMRDEPAIGAWLIQCSDLPPYSADIARATGLPVWDMNLLIRHFHAAATGDGRPAARATTDRSS